MPFFITIPHSGEQIPPEAGWLNGLDEVTLMGDVDRYVDLLYQPILDALQIPHFKTQWHRYAADLNRIPEDIDCEAVLGNKNPPGSFPRGFHWVYNTQSEKILHHPLSLSTHEALVKRVYQPFHAQVQGHYAFLHQHGFTKTFHIDAHSCPSIGTTQHRDPGQRRADVIVSDSKGKSSDPRFKDLVIQAFQKQGLEVAYNWPYFGGRLTEHYGQPQKGHHVIQVELNRSLYMDESSKQWRKEGPLLQQKISEAIRHIVDNLKELI